MAPMNGDVFCAFERDAFNLLTECDEARLQIIISYLFSFASWCRSLMADASPIHISTAPPASTADAPAKRPSPRISDFTKTSQLRRTVSAVVVLLMSYHFVGDSWKAVFQYHPLMMTVAFVGFLPEIVHLANNFRRCRSMVERQQTVDHHLQFAIAMKMVGLVGFAAIEVSKIQRKKKHFTTWHGLIGLFCVMVLVLQVMLGIVYHYRLFPTKKFPGIFSLLRKAHQWLGLGLVALGAASMYLGMQTHFAAGAVPDTWARMFFAVATIVLALVAYLRE
jgi:hypothetical protein